MDVELLNRQGEEIVGSKTLPGNDCDSTDGADSTPLTLPAGLPIACARDDESRRQTWERLRREARAVGMTRKAAIAYASREVDRLHPHFQPLPEPEPLTVVESAPDPDPPAVVEPDPPAAPAVPPPSSGNGLAGLGDLPADWPTLPANATLSVEVAWVQANRIRVKPNGSSVDLSLALSPAPSYAALSWLETSVLYPSKWADVTVKASTDRQDDAEDVRRERLALVEAHAMLVEARGSLAG